MPRRMRRRRRRRRRRGLTTRQAAFRALSRVDNERKVHDLTTSGTPFNVSIATPVTVSLSAIAEGSGNNQRIGKRAKMLSISGRVFIEARGAPATIRAILVLDKQSNGGLATVENLLADAVNEPLNSANNVNNFKRFTVLKTWMMRVDTASFTQQHKRFHKRLKFSTQYNGAAAATGTISSNHLLLFFLSDAGPGDNTPNIQWYIRVNFVG